MHKRILGLTVAAMAIFAGVVHAEDKKVTIGVSIPAADHGWTAGVVFHAQRVAKLLMAEHPGLNVIVKTSPDAAEPGKRAGRSDYARHECVGDPAVRSRPSRQCHQ